MRRLALAVLIGLAISVGLSTVSYFLMPAEGVVWPVWYGPFRTLISALLTVAPGLAAGWFAHKDGWRVGAVLGLCVTVSALATVPMVWDRITFGLAANALIFGGVSNILTHSVAGAAGELLSAQLPPNKSFKPNPLRGSA